MRIRGRAAAMDQDWYYGIGDNDTHGPVSFEQLVAVLRARPDWRDVPVWCSDFADWRTAKEVHQIAFQLARGTPAPASPPKDTQPKRQTQGASSMPAKPVPMESL